ncbi:MAG TPA: pilus assembly protein N-terminal domain-containing protein [Vicinamibacterales bacterium]|nr:pilus assembly protein N-terminal domain-containing protein [Vicinamibacterales bacterium]
MGRRFASALIFLIVIAGGSVLYADDSVRLMVGRSTVVSLGSPIARVSLTSPDVADALVTAPTELLINGKTPGTISMFVWDRAGAIRRYEIVVQRDLARLSEQMKQLFPTESIDVQSNGRNIVLSGTVTNKDFIERAINLASGYVDKKEEVVTLLQVQEGARSNQVLLHVRFAEVNRTALTELGASLFTGAGGYKDYIARSTTQQYAAPVFDNSDPTNPKLLFSDFLNLFLFNTKEQLGTVIKALQTRGLFQSLAEPNLVAESGKEASFLAGGEFPVPVAQGTGANIGITVQFKEFGIRLTFTPIVNGDRVHLKVRPEVSALDFSNAVTLNGFKIPALTTRRTETELELQNGQTFAVAGLLSNSMNKTLQKMPGIGDIPILGLLFKSQSAQKDRTELVVMITPEILANNSPGVTPNLPRMPDTYLPPLDPKNSHEMPSPAFRPAGRGSAANAPQTPVQPVAPAPMPAGDPVSAAARVQALTPATSTAPQQPVVATMPVAAAPIAATRPQMPEPDKKALDKAQMQDHSRNEVAKATDGKARAKEIEQERRKAEEDKKAQDKAAREQAKRDAEAAKVAAAAAKRQAEIDKAAADAAAKRAAEQAKKQAEADKKNSKSVSEAEAKLKAAQAAYESEVAKSKRQAQ